MTCLYNENDAYPAQWLRNLIDAGHIAPGTVDERSIVDLEPKDIAGAVQFHAFAGIGVWSHALRAAGWPDDAPAWTGSCPCQPFSAAGKRRSHADERHLWPAWFRLIRECRPPVIFGEQVSSKDGLAWIDAVHSDLEGIGYAVGALDLPAASVGAPHIRQRIYFVAVSVSERNGDSGSATSGAESVQREARERERIRSDAGQRGADGLMGNPDGEGSQGRSEPGNGAGELSAGATGMAGGMADAVGTGTSRLREHGGQAAARSVDAAGAGLGFWSDARWIACRDGKLRPTGPGVFPLADGATQRLGRLRAYGNAIVAPLAAEFIRCVMEAM